MHAIKTLDLCKYNVAKHKYTSYIPDSLLYIRYTRDQTYKHIFKSKPTATFKMFYHAFLQANSDQVIDGQILKYLISKTITHCSLKIVS